MSIEPRLPNPTNESKRQHVFMSYSSVDRPLVSQIAETIQREGYMVWVDNISTDFDGYLVGGENWQYGLANGLNQAILVVLSVSPDSMKSSWVAAEIQLARDIGRPIIPVLIRALDPASKERWLALKLDQLHTRDLTIDYHRGIQYLLTDISKYAKPIKLATSIRESQGMSRHEFIDELLAQMQRDDENASKALCGLLQSENVALVSDVLRRLKAHPSAKKLPPDVVKTLIELHSHPDTLVAGWSSKLVSKT